MDQVAQLLFLSGSYDLLENVYSIFYNDVFMNNIGFPGSSADKDSACNAGDPNSIPGSKNFPGKGIGYPLQYSQVSLVAQMVKNLPTLWETWVQFDPWVGKIPCIVCGNSLQYSRLQNPPGGLQSTKLQRVEPLNTHMNNTDK